MRIFKFIEFIKESMSNTIAIEDGEYYGTIKGYDVTLNNSMKIKTTIGFRNMFPIKVYVVVKNGIITVYTKQAVLFTNDKDQQDYKNKYKNIDNDPIFLKMKSVLNEAHINAKGELEDIDFDEEELDYLSKSLSDKYNKTANFPVNYKDPKVSIGRIEHESKKLNKPIKSLLFGSFDGYIMSDVVTIKMCDDFIYEATLFMLLQSKHKKDTESKSIVMYSPNDHYDKATVLYLNGHFTYDKKLKIKKRNRVLAVLERVSKMGYAEAFTYIKNLK
jgi:hypothetical protein